MKNSKIVSEYLDYHAETMRLMSDRTLEGAQAASERILSGRTDELYQACLADGWTAAELENIFARRFGFRVER